MDAATKLPPELATSNGRASWFREAKRQLDERRAAEARPIPKSRPARLKESKRRLEEELWTESRANEAYLAYRAGRDAQRPPAGNELAAQPVCAARHAGREDQHDRSGLAQRQDAPRLHTGLQRQAVCNEQHIVIAAEVSADSPDFGRLEPMISATQRELQQAGISEELQVVVADAGY